LAYDGPVRVLIAGCGYLGMALGRVLAERGDQVFGLRRRADGLPPPIEPVPADLLDLNALDRALPAGLDAVVYAAAAEAHTVTAYQAAYVRGLANLAAAFERLEGWPRRSVYVSSTGVYAHDDGSWIDEHTPAEPTEPTARALLAGEGIARRAGAIVLRLGGIYGPGRDRLARHALAEPPDPRASAAAGRYTNRIHRDDAALALAHLLRLPDPAQVYLGVDEEPALERAVLGYLRARLRVPAGLPPTAPDRADEPALVSAPRAAAGKRCSSARLRASGFRFRYPTYREGYAALLADAPAAPAAAAVEAGR
jgi:nucleoside-diphosphate-sugar epimerase